MTFVRIDPLFIAEIRRRTSLAELIGGTVILKPAGRELRGLCPFHRERTPSFYVVEAKAFWHCFGCGTHGDAVGWVMKTTEASFPEAVEWLAARAGLRADRPPEPAARPIVPRPAAEILTRERRQRIDLARQVWSMAVPIEGTTAERYLRRQRRIRLPLMPSLRFHPRLEHPFADRARGLRWPAMVGAIQGQGPTDGDADGKAASRAIVGVHLTYLDADGNGKAAPPPGWPADKEWKPKIMRGLARAGAVRLTQCQDLMIVAEGIETALSMLQAHWDSHLRCAHIDGEPVGVWAALSLDNLGMIALPEAVREVILAVDNDAKIPDASDRRQLDPEAALDLAAQRHADLGRNVRIARPPPGTDFNDLLCEGSGAESIADADVDFGDA